MRKDPSLRGSYFGSISGAFLHCLRHLRPAQQVEAFGPLLMKLVCRGLGPSAERTPLILGKNNCGFRALGFMSLRFWGFIGFRVGGVRGLGCRAKAWVLSPLCSSWIIFTMRLYIAPIMTPNIGQLQGGGSTQATVLRLCLA